ncbi:hypothetical protein [Sodalis sp. dw_96]|uniref:hypothetical protein n=1 Tax=Sodalis sp. dw_96 TaxID=2719794 RepID=UPI001BD65010|nr:hypothetical protein [Sodalis sp. dw_96]
MSWESFIEKNVREALVKQGYTPAIAQVGADEAIALYRRMSQGSGKGRIYDDVLRHARLWAEKYGLPARKQKPKAAIAPRRRQ